MTVSVSKNCDFLPCITIGLTCFNASKTIERALHSALIQDWPVLEVVVVDDASTDCSWEIIAQIANDDSRICTIQHDTNKGVAAARNTILSSASGQFVAFFDDDDVSRPDRLRLQYDRIISYEQQAGSQLVACYSSGQRIYTNGYEMPIRAVGADGKSPIGSVMADYLLFNKRLPEVFYGGGTPTCSLMARAEVFHNLDGFDATMRRQEDIDFAIRLSFMGGHFVGIPEPVLTQYASTGSDKSARSEFESSLKLIDKYADYLRMQNSYRYMQLWTELRFYHFSGEELHAAIVLLRLLIMYPVRTIRHFANSATRRFCHERRMKFPAHG